MFDAAATVCGTSLNSALLKGPDLNQSLTAILLQFRMRRVGVCGDVAEMFHQVVMQPEDRCAQRFLWRSSNGPLEHYEMTVMTFGATCSPTSAQYVKNVNASRFDDTFSDGTDAIWSLHYVDDYVASFESVEEAVRITRDVVNIHASGGFRLRGFVSNSKAVLDALGVADAADIGAVDLELDTAATNKILGLRWCTRTDAFIFALRFDRVDVDVVAGVRQPTKREILSASMSIFDPFGFLADFTLHAKLLLQDLWKTGTGWDQAVPMAIYTRWQLWCAELDNVRQFSHLMTTTTDVQHAAAPFRGRE